MELVSIVTRNMGHLSLGFVLNSYAVLVHICTQFGICNLQHIHEFIVYNGNAQFSIEASKPRLPGSAV